MKLRQIFLFIICIMTLNINAHIYQIDVLNDNVFLFYEYHTSDDELRDEIDIIFGLPRGVYIGINHIQVLSTIKAIKENFNLKNSLLTFEAMCEIKSIYKNFAERSYFGPRVFFPELAYFIAKFENIPFLFNIEFRRFITNLDSLEYSKVTDSEPSKIETIIGILETILKELLSSSSKLIRDKTEKYFIPKLDDIILSKRTTFAENSLKFLLKNLNIRELAQICHELFDYRALNIILSNPDKNHFFFIGGWHCENIKKILINEYQYKFNAEKSYKEKNDNPINIKKYFDTLFPKPKQLISKL